LMECNDVRLFQEWTAHWHVVFQPKWHTS
jgi:hypothetical protein